MEQRQSKRERNDYPALLRFRRQTKVPCEYVCPISWSIMSDPVLDPSDPEYRAVERAAFESHVHQYGVCPFTGLPPGVIDTLPTVERAISDFLMDATEAEPISRHSPQLAQTPVAKRPRLSEVQPLPPLPPRPNPRWLMDAVRSCGALAGTANIRDGDGVNKNDNDVHDCNGNHSDERRAVFQIVGTEEIPATFFCPLSRVLMLDPVGCKGGSVLTMERAALAAYVELYGTHPQTGKPMALSDIYPDNTMRRLIARWLAKFHDNSVHLHTAPAPPPAATALAIAAAGEANAPGQINHCLLPQPQLEAGPADTLVAGTSGGGGAGTNTGPTAPEACLPRALANTYPSYPLAAGCRGSGSGIVATAAGARGTPLLSLPAPGLPQRGKAVTEAAASANIGCTQTEPAQVHASGATPEYMHMPPGGTVFGFEAAAHLPRVAAPPPPSVPSLSYSPEQHLPPPPAPPQPQPLRLASSAPAPVAAAPEPQSLAPGGALERAKSVPDNQALPEQPAPVPESLQKLVSEQPDPPPPQSNISHRPSTSLAASGQMLSQEGTKQGPGGQMVMVLLEPIGVTAGQSSGQPQDVAGADNQREEQQEGEDCQPKVCIKVELTSPTSAQLPLGFLNPAVAPATATAAAAATAVGGNGSGADGEARLPPRPPAAAVGRGQGGGAAVTATAAAAAAAALKRRASAGGGNHVSGVVIGAGGGGTKVSGCEGDGRSRMSPVDLVSDSPCVSGNGGSGAAAAAAPMDRDGSAWPSANTADSNRRAAGDSDIGRPQKMGGNEVGEKAAAAAAGAMQRDDGGAAAAMRGSGAVAGACDCRTAMVPVATEQGNGAEVAAPPPPAISAEVAEVTSGQLWFAAAAAVGRWAADASAVSPLESDDGEAGNGDAAALSDEDDGEWQLQDSGRNGGRGPLFRKRFFSPEELEALVAGVETYGENNWSMLKSCTPRLRGRTESGLQQKWRALVKQLESNWRRGRHQPPSNLQARIAAIRFAHGGMAAAWKAVTTAAAAAAAAVAAAGASADMDVDVHDDTTAAATAAPAAAGQPDPQQALGQAVDGNWQMAQQGGGADGSGDGSLPQWPRRNSLKDKWHARLYSHQEVEALVDGILKYGCDWTAILREKPVLRNRNQNSIKYKWASLCVGSKNGWESMRAERPTPALCRKIQQAISAMSAKGVQPQVTSTRRYWGEKGAPLVVPNDLVYELFGQYAVREKARIKVRLDGVMESTIHYGNLRFIAAHNKYQIVHCPSLRLMASGRQVVGWERGAGDVDLIAVFRSASEGGGQEGADGGGGSDGSDGNGGTADGSGDGMEVDHASGEGEGAHEYANEGWGGDCDEQSAREDPASSEGEGEDEDGPGGRGSGSGGQSEGSSEAEGESEGEGKEEEEEEAGGGGGGEGNITGAEESKDDDGKDDGGDEEEDEEQQGKEKAKRAEAHTKAKVDAEMKEAE